MKKKGILFSTLYSLMLGMSLTACSDNDDNDSPATPIIDPVEYVTYILNEGSWGSNDARIAQFYHNESSVRTNDIYQDVNGKKMGDVANGMLVEDNYIYVVMNGSKYVSKLDLHCKEVARYTFPETDGEPRCIEVEDGYVYVTQYGGQVSKINAKDMTLVSTFQGGGNLEGIVVKDGKLYVANSYQQEGSGNFVYNKDVFVINAQTMALEKSIEVVDNPAKIQEIDDLIYVFSKGDYDMIQPVLQVINPNDGSIKNITSADKITEGHNGLIYGVRSTFDESWQPTNTLFTYNPNTGVINETSFLQDAPSAISTANIYLLEVDEETGYIYVGTTDYLTNGTIYQFDINGKLIKSFDSGGINPSTMIFID